MISLYIIARPHFKLLSLAEVSVEKARPKVYKNGPENFKTFSTLNRKEGQKMGIIFQNKMFQKKSLSKNVQSKLILLILKKIRNGSFLTLAFKVRLLTFVVKVN